MFAHTFCSDLPDVIAFQHTTTPLSIIYMLRKISRMWRNDDISISRMEMGQIHFIFVEGCEGGGGVVHTVMLM